MDNTEFISEIRKKFPDFAPLSVEQFFPDELCIKVSQGMFKDTCFSLHKVLSSPVMMLFAIDNRRDSASFEIRSVFVNYRKSQWVIVSMDIPQENPCFETLAKTMHSSTLFEREIWEMFGIEPKGNPDLRRLNLHDEVCPVGNFPLRKDFSKIQTGNLGEYKFTRVEGDGIFEIPVGPVHAGIIGPGHFRFSVAGEPIINLETRLGFTHRGVEKLFENKIYTEAITLSERISGDSSFAHSIAFSQAAEKISGIAISRQSVILRGIFLELERLYNHVNDIGGIALDVGFSFPSAFASIIKETILQLNEKLTQSRYLKGVNVVGGVLVDIDENKKQMIYKSIKDIREDFKELVKILNRSVSFMDRIDTTGVLRRKTAEDFGVIGLVARACGIPLDLRKYFSPICKEVGFKMMTQEYGDVQARLRVRICEFEESCRLIEEFLGLQVSGKGNSINPELKEGCALGYAEAWRGPVLYWLKTDAQGAIERCKVVDASFHNWQGLSYAVLGNIIPDFPLCNKSFDLSYSGNDL